MKIKEENLLKNKYPELLKEWDYVKNKDIDVNTISYSSHKKVNWLCLTNKEHHYIASVNNKTNINLRGKPSGCKQCFHDSVRIHDKKEISEHKNNHIENTVTTKIGDATEEYVVNLLNSMNCYKQIVNLGNIGASSDISITDYENKTYLYSSKNINLF